MAARAARGGRAGTWWRPSAALLLALTTAGCAFQRTAREVRAAGELGVIAGEVEAAGGTSQTFVLMYALRPGGRTEVTGVSELSDLTDVWGFVCDAGQQFVLGAFKDLDGDGVRGPDEPAGYLGSDLPLQLTAKTRVRGVVISIDAETPTDPRFPLDVTGRAGERRMALRFTTGQVVTLDDERFAPEHVSAGMWTPLSALQEKGGGIFFLEPYDATRIPVLFVHGIGGSPRDFRVLIERLDRTRFQPWLFYYPSGFRLATVAGALSLHLARLRDRLGFEKVYVAAHSMGGLICRAAILSLDADPRHRHMVALFVTLASPLGGHAAVKWGLTMTPEPVPAWIDLEPGSPFIQSIAKRLPRHVPYYLFFGFRRRGNLFMPLSSDSVVPVESQLPMWAQRDAVRMWGFDTDHMEILTKDEPVATFETILEETATKAP